MLEYSSYHTAFLTDTLLSNLQLALQLDFKFFALFIQNKSYANFSLGQIVTSLLGFRIRVFFHERWSIVQPSRTILSLSHTHSIYSVQSSHFFFCYLTPSLAMKWNLKLYKKSTSSTITVKTYVYLVLQLQLKMTVKLSSRLHWAISICYSSA